MKKEIFDNRHRSKYVEQPPIEGVRRYGKGSRVYAKTPAGPIVEVTVTDVTTGGFQGCIGNADISKLVLAGVPESSPGFTMSFGDHQVVTAEEYFRDNPSEWSIKEAKKSTQKGVQSKDSDYITKSGNETRRRKNVRNGS